MKRILVTGATGTVGRQVVSQLLATGAEVRAMTRDPESAALPEIEVVRDDLTVPETLDRCLDGIEAVFLVWTIPASAAPLNMLLAAWAAAIGQPALVTTTVTDVTGRPAQPFRDWVADSANAFRG